MVNTKDITKVSLAQFLRFYKQPISEEQAWAICFHCCCKMNDTLAQGLDSVVQMKIPDIDELYIHSDGSISFTTKHNYDGHINQQPREILEDKLTESLGKLIYKALDWGIESHMERELSESLAKLITFMLKLNAETSNTTVALQDVIKLTESLGKLIYKALDWGIESHMERELSESLAKLITFMLKLNAETSNTTVALQDVIKICEDHFHRPSEAASHYTTICQMLFSEYIELQKLMLTIQSCKEYLGRMDVEDCSARQKTNNSKSMRLQKVMGQTLHSIPPGEGILSSYSMVVDDIKNKRYSLHAVSVWKWKEKTSQEFSLHEKLMMEVKNPPKLRPIFEQKSSNNYKGDTQKFVLNSPCNSIISEQNISINFSKAKKTQLSCIHSDLELKIKLGELCEDGRGSESKLSPTYNQTCSRWSLPSIANLMGTRYLEVKGSCQRETSNLPSRAELCFVCHNQFFIWPYVCQLCTRALKCFGFEGFEVLQNVQWCKSNPSFQLIKVAMSFSRIARLLKRSFQSWQMSYYINSVICKDCCIKMSMPVRPCVRLPLNFFKVIQLGKEDNQGLHNQKTAQLEVEQWDSSRIALVFEPHCLTPPLACRIKSMMDWPSMDICIKCEQYLLEMLSHHSPCRKRRLSWIELE